MVSGAAGACGSLAGQVGRNIASFHLSISVMVSDQSLITGGESSFTPTKQRGGQKKL